ncbi:MAG: hypothetical protein WBG46_08040 [Nonlabens sp.]
MKKVRGATILENLIASVILMILFVIAGNAINNIFKQSIDSRDLAFDNQVKKTVYLLKNNKETAPVYFENGSNYAEFTKENELVKVKIVKNNQITLKTICCIEQE